MISEQELETCRREINSINPELYKLEKRLDITDGRWIQSYTGRKVFPLSMTPDQICIEDVAHALSLKCRFGGHCKNFYSIAEHSIYVTEVVAQINSCIDTIRWALMHDAEEAYLPDILRPVKSSLPELVEFEYNCRRAVIIKFDLYPHQIPDIVKLADTSVLYAERDQIMCGGPTWARVDKLYLPNLKIQCLSPEKAEELFLKKFKELFR